MRQDASHDPAVAAQALEALESLGDELNDPLTREIGSDGLRADPATGSRPGPPPRDGHDPSQNLFWLADLATSGRRVTLRDDPRPRPRRVDRDHTMTDQSAPLVEENDISHPKARWGSWFHRELIPLPQRGAHAPTRHTETKEPGAKQKVTDLVKISQAEPIAPDRSADFQLTV